jgi:hypothetical protein
MVGAADPRHNANRLRTIVTAVAAVIALTMALAALTPTAAHASGCTDSWTNPAGGSWFTPGNWSNGTPPTAAEEACITLSGTYTVTMTQTSTTGTVSVQSLTIGGASGTQTLAVGSSCSENAQLTTHGLVNNANGVLTLTNGDSCANNVSLSGQVTNAGEIATEPGAGGERQLRGNTTNTGTIAIDTDTLYDGADVKLTNEGAIALAEGKDLTATSANTITNAAGGSIADQKVGGAYRSGNVYMSHATFNEDAGTMSGSQPVVVDDGTLNYGAGAGAGIIALRGATALSGTISAGQILLIQGTCSEHAVATAASGLRNGGRIMLTDADGCGDNDTLSISSGTLTNTGTIDAEAGTSGQRNLQGNLHNRGTVELHANTSYNGSEALFTNEGQVELFEGTLTLSNESSFKNAGGNIFAKGSSNSVLAGSGTSFTEGEGTTDGYEPVIVDDGTLTYNGDGKSAIQLQGSDTLLGGPSKGQLLAIASTCGGQASTTAAAGFTNAGTITLTNDSDCANNATLTVSSGTLENTGTIATELRQGGQRNLEGSITNTGKLALSANTSASTKGATLLNEGAIDIADGVDFSVTGAQTVTNGTGGTIMAAGLGALVQTEGTFNQGPGQDIGSEPVILDDLTLDYHGHGSGRIALRGTSSLTGSVRGGETLELQSTCAHNALITAASGFSNKGTIELTNFEGCAKNVTLDPAGGTLDTGGALKVDNPHGGARTIEGSLSNSSLLVVAAGATLKVSGSYTQTSAGKLIPYIASASSFGALSVTGSATIAGELAVHAVSPFKGTAGEEFAILSSGALSGMFSTVSEDQIDSSGLYYMPTYSSTGAALAVTQATLELSKASGAPGTKVMLKGSGYLPGGTITPTFTDRNGHATTFTAVTANGSGEFATEITIPESADTGEGTIVVRSVTTGMAIGDIFEVT